MALNLSSSSKRKTQGQYCCVVGCHRQSLRDKDEVNFRFPAKSRYPEKRQLWIKAVQRKNDDGSDWEPKEWTRICSDHFVGELHREEKNHPDYVPSIFNSGHTKPKTLRDCARFDRLMKRRMAASTASAAATPKAPIADELDSSSEMSSKIPDIKVSSVRGGNLALHDQHDTLFQESDFDLTVNSDGQPANSLYEAPKTSVSVPKKLFNGLLLKPVEPSIVPGLNLKPVSPTDIAHLVTKKGMKRDSEAMTDIPYDNQPDYKPSRFPTSHIRPSSDVNSINEPYYVPSIIKNGQREFGKFDKLESRAAMVTSSETSSERATTPMKAAEMALNDQVDIEMDTNFTIKWPSQMPRKPEGDRMVPIEDDEDTAFFKYMASQTRQMKRGAKKKFFRQIQDLLSEYESAEEQM